MSYGSAKHSAKWISYLFSVMFLMGLNGLLLISAIEFLGFMHFVFYSSHFVSFLVVLKSSSRTELIPLYFGLKLMMD